MLANERSQLVGPTKLPSGIGLHLTLSLIFLLAPLAIAIAALSAENGAPSRLLPWSASTVGWGALSGEFSFGLTHFSVCKTGDTNSCQFVNYEDTQAVMKEGATIVQSGRSIMWMLTFASILAGLSALLTTWSLVSKEGIAATRSVKVASWALSLLASLLLLASAVVWARDCHDNIANYTSVRYSWGFSLMIVGGIFAGFTTILHCIRNSVDEYSGI